MCLHTLLLCLLTHHAIEFVRHTPAINIADPILRACIALDKMLLFKCSFEGVNATIV